MKTTAFTVIYSHVIEPTHFTYCTSCFFLEMEKCPVSGKPILEMERCITKFFGIKTYGVHVNCFFRNQDGQICLWIGRRSPTKETWPGLLDNCFAGRSFLVNFRSFEVINLGGYTAGLDIMEILVKEAAEEASIPEELCSVAKFVGSLEFSRHAGGSLQPEKEFIFDIELPADFQDGEQFLNF